MKLSTLLSSATLLVVATTAWAAGQVTEAHAGTRKGTVYAATPQIDVSPVPGANSAAEAGAGAASAAATLGAAAGGSAPVEPGGGVEIISGGSSSEGAAKVGRLPVLQ